MTYHQLKYLLWSVVVGVTLSLTSCMKWDYGDAVEDFNATGAGLFITNEGNFQYGNATLSYYDPATKQVQNEIFFRANGMKLGDVAQSMTIYDNKGWVVVNNSHVIFAIDLNTFKEVGRIENLTSPRYIHFLSDEKAYVTQLWDNRIFIINPKKYEITGYIQVPDMTMESGSTEQMVQYGKYVYCNCWSYQNRIIKIDTETDQVVDELKVGIQPTSLVMDKYNKMWTVTDGGYEGSPYGYEAPSLYRIDAETFTVEKQFKFKLGDWPSEVQLNGDRDKLYWINKAIWSMDVTASHVPVRPFLEYSGTIYYGLTVNPANGEVYIADAIDYQQQGSTGPLAATSANRSGEESAQTVQEAADALGDAVDLYLDGGATPGHVSSTVVAADPHERDGIAILREGVIRELVIRKALTLNGGALGA